MYSGRLKVERIVVVVLGVEYTNYLESLINATGEMASYGTGENTSDV